MKGFKTFAAVLVVAATLSGCAPWTRVDSPEQTAADNSFTLQAPVGWVRKGASDGIYVTRDGGFQFIEAVHRSADKAFPTLKKPSDAAMLPSELAELTLAELKSDKDWETLKVVSNKPAMLGGKPAFRLHVGRTTDKGLRIERVIYGMAGEKGLYTVVYEAPTLHFFGRDMGTFESLVQSFRVNG